MHGVKARGRDATYAAVLSFALALSGCGGSDTETPDTEPLAYTPRKDIKNFNGDVAPGESKQHAEAIITHQREDHCGQRLIEVRCEEQASQWLCDWRTDQGRGSTSLEKETGGGGIPVTCG